MVFIDFFFLQKGMVHGSKSIFNEIKTKPIQEQCKRKNKKLNNKNRKDLKPKEQTLSEEKWSV